MLAALGLVPSLSATEARAVEASTRLGKPKPFSFSKLMAAAKERAAAAYVPEVPRAFEALEAIDLMWGRDGADVWDLQWV